MKKPIIATLGFVLVMLVHTSYAQELNCQVQVMHQKIQVVNEKFFENMQNAIFEFMNNTRFTDNVFASNERIECSILINITQQINTEKYTATLQVQSRRPVYGSTYYTTMLNHKEKDNGFVFNYIDQQEITFNENNYNNLTSVLAYYAYLIIGLDFDSFGMEAGTPWYEKARKIVSLAQNAEEQGWRAYEDSKENNRYWIIETLLNDSYKPYRRALYRYHRLGLDIMYDKIDYGRTEMVESMIQLKKVYNQKPGLFLLTLFFNAKSDEIINIFNESFPNEKTRVYDIVKELDVANAEKYKSLKPN